MNLILNMVSESSLASLAFFIVTLFVGITSIILFFHWKKYGMGGKTMVFTEILYFTVSIILLSTAFFAVH